MHISQVRFKCFFFDSATDESRSRCMEPEPMPCLYCDLRCPELRN